MPPSQEQSDWVARVLGFRTDATPASAPHDGSLALVASLVANAMKVAGARRRPASSPRQQATERLLGTMTAKPVPEDREDLPAHAETFTADYLVFVEAERPASSQKLGVGSPVPGPDQLLGIADLFAATQRAMSEWETLLNEAETADSAIDLIEDQEKEERDETEYADSLTTYNERRKQTIVAEEKALKLMTELQGAFEGLSESAQTQALKEAGESG